MSTVTETPKVPEPQLGGVHAQALHGGHLPGWARWACLGGSLLVAAAFFGLVGWSLVGWLVVSAVLFLASITVATHVAEGARHAADAFWRTLVWLAFLLALVPLVSIVATVLIHGLPGLLTPGFLASDMKGVTGTQDLAAAQGTSAVLGGVKHALVGTLLITLAATVISVPVGLLTSIWLVEYSAGGWLSRMITFLVDVMTGIPSIVAGLFAAGIMMKFFELVNGGVSGGLQVMGITAAIALSVLMIPTVVRSTEEMLRVVPNELREGAYALGVRKWRTIMMVVIPTAISGIASGVTLAIARVIGETAPILVTTGVAVSTNWDLFKGWMMTLPVFIYRQLMNPTAPSAPGPSTQRAWAAALILILVVMLLNLLARLIASRFAPKTSGH